jgi:hypothetical protein
MELNSRELILFPDHTPKYKTKTELELSRRANNWSAEPPQKVISLKNWKIVEKQAARIKQGLAATPFSPRQLSLFTDCKTKSELVKARREIQGGKGEDLYAVHKSPEERLAERENSKSTSPCPGLTYNQIREAVRKNDHDHLTEVFGKQSLGIHKETLPKYSENIDLFSRIHVTTPQDPKLLSSNLTRTHHKPRNKPYKEITDSPTRINFPVDHYLSISKFRRVRDKAVGACIRPRATIFDDLSRISAKKQKRTLKSSKDRCSSTKSVRSSGFFR